MAVQNRLSAKFTATSDRKKDEQGALVEFYSVADQKPLWVDANGLTERGKAVMAEIAEADDYGLRSSDYVAAQALTASTPPIRKRSTGSPTPRSRSAMPCSTTPPTHAAAASSRSA